MTEFLGKLEELAMFFLEAMRCLFLTITGQETDCESCWKCMALRWVVFVGACTVLHLFFGFLFDLVAVICLVLLFFYGKGPWQRIREYFWPPTPPENSA